MDELEEGARRQQSSNPREGEDYHIVAVDDAEDSGSSDHNEEDVGRRNEESTSEDNEAVDVDDEDEESSEEDGEEGEGIKSGSEGEVERTARENADDGRSVDMARGMLVFYCFHISETADLLVCLFRH